MHGEVSPIKVVDDTCIVRCHSSIAPRCLYKDVLPPLAMTYHPSPIHTHSRAR
jgi:hypothetical protein